MWSFLFMHVKNNWYSRLSPYWNTCFTFISCNKTHQCWWLLNNIIKYDSAACKLMYYLAPKTRTRQIIDTFKSSWLLSIIADIYLHTSQLYMQSDSLLIFWWVEMVILSTNQMWTPKSTSKTYMNKKREVYTRRESLLVSGMHKKYDIARSQCL